MWPRLVIHTCWSQNSPRWHGEENAPINTSALNFPTGKLPVGRTGIDLLQNKGRGKTNNGYRQWRNQETNLFKSSSSPNYYLKRGLVIPVQEMRKLRLRKAKRLA